MAVWSKVGDSNRNPPGESAWDQSESYIDMGKRSIAFLLNTDIICGTVAQAVALMNVDHGRLDFFVAGMRLHLLDRSTGLDGERTACVPERMRPDLMRKPGPPCGTIYNAVDGTL